jgi:hypothetical protein
MDIAMPAAGQQAFRIRLHGECLVIKQFVSIHHLIDQLAR